MKKLLIITTLFLMSISLMAGKRTLQQGELRLTASADYQEFIPDKGDNTHTITAMGHGIDFMGMPIGGNPGYNQFMFLETEASGLSAFYGINENMQVAISVPIFSFFSGGMDLKQTFGSAKIGFLYVVPMVAFDITINPFVSSPFLQFMSVETKLGKGETESSFEQAFGAGVSVAIEGGMDKIHWGGYLGLSKYFEREKEVEVLGTKVTTKYGKAMFMSFSAMIGYELSETTMLRGNLYYDLDEFQNDGDISSFAIKLGADIALSKTMDLSASFIFRKAVDNDNGKILGAIGGLSIRF